MAALHIKDSEAAELAAELARLRGMTKTAAVKDALRKEPDAARSAGRDRAEDLMIRLDRYREEHPMPPSTGPKAEKIFFDALWDQP